MNNSANNYASVDEYISTFPAEVQEILKKLRKMVKELAPKAEESIAYGMPAYKLYKIPLVYYAAYKHHIGFYPIPTGISAFQKELTPYIYGKGTAQFPLDKPIPYDLIEKIVKFRVQENEEKYGEKK